MYIKEEDLDFSNFSCCGDEDLFPFKCSVCGHIMVFCYECDTLYSDLRDTSQNNEVEINNFDPKRPIFSCPKCHHDFEYYFMKNPKYEVSREEWLRSGYGRLLTNAGD